MQANIVALFGGPFDGRGLELNRPFPRAIRLPMPNEIEAKFISESEIAKPSFKIAEYDQHPDCPYLYEHWR